MEEELILKWGTIKGWENLTEKSMKIIQLYFSDGFPASCATDHPDENRKHLLCDLIDQLEGKIYLSWDGKYVTKDEAKKYIIEYE